MLGILITSTQIQSGEKHVDTTLLFWARFIHTTDIWWFPLATHPADVI